MSQMALCPGYECILPVRPVAAGTQTGTHPAGTQQGIVSLKGTSTQEHDGWVWAECSDLLK